VLREENDLALAAFSVAHFGGVLEQVGKLIPFPVLSRMNDFFRLFFKGLQNEDFRFQFLNGLGGCGLVYQFLLEALLLFGVQVVLVFRGRPG